MQLTTASLLVVLGLGLGLPAGEALGKNPPLKPPSALVVRGEAALGMGNLTVAEQALTAAYRQTPSADLLFPLGRLAAAQGQLLAAQDLMRRYLNDPAATPDPGKTAEAQKVLAQPRPPSGKIRVQGDRGGLVLLDGRMLGRLPLVQPLLAAPGQRTVAIQYPGKLLDIPVEVLAGRMVDIQCTRATGAIFLNQLPALLLLAELPPLSPATFEQFLDAVERAAQGEQLTLLKPEALLTLVPELKSLPEPKAAAELKQCLSQPECLQKILRQTQLEHALRVRVTAAPLPPNAPAADPPVAPSASAPAPKWELATELLHASVLGPASTQSLPCSPCSEQKAAAALQEVVSHTLAVGLVRPRGTLSVSSDPLGAEVRWGERRLGQTPLTLPTWVGEYTVELRQPGHVSVLQTVRVESGQTAQIAATLPLIAPPPPPPLPPAPRPVAEPPVPLRWERGPRPRWRLEVGVASLIVGVALTVGGVVRLETTLTRPCGSELPVPAGCDQPTLMSEVNAGAGLTAAGGALTLVGIGILAWPGPRRQVPASRTKGAAAARY